MLFRQSYIRLAFALVTLASACKFSTNTAELSVIQGIVTLQDTTAPDSTWNSSPTLVLQITAEPDNLHPTNGTSGQRSEIFGYIHRYLVTTNSASGLSPDLLQSLPAVSNDGCTFKYRLREGITWDNGEPVTAADVFFTCQVNIAPQSLNPAYKSYWSNMKDFIPDPKDPLAFTLIMKQPHIQNVSFLSGFPILQRNFYDPGKLLQHLPLDQLSKDTTLHAWFELFNSDEFGRSAAKINGLGDYIVADWTPGISILLKRKKHEPGAPEQLLFKIAKDESSVALELKKQVYDVTSYLSMTTFLQLASDPALCKNYHCVLSPTFNYSYLCFNTQPDSTHSQFFNNRDVREAIAHLISVDRIIELLYQSTSNSARRMTTNVSPFKNECDTTLVPIDYNLEKAKSLLNTSGWLDHDGDGVIDKKGIRMSMELLYLNTSADWKDMAGLITQELAKAGIEVEPIAVEQKIFLEKARNHNFDLLLGSWGGSSAPEDYAQLWSTASWTNHGSNYSGFGNTKTDSLIAEINHSVNDTDRINWSHLLQREIYHEQPYVFLYTSLRKTIIHKRWGHVRLFPDRPGMNVGEFRLIPRP